jgi:hypothetical protein
LRRRYFVLRVSRQLRPLLIITVAVTTGTATTAIITDITTTTIIIGTGQAIPGITAIGKAPARAGNPGRAALNVLPEEWWHRHLACGATGVSPG